MIVDEFLRVYRVRAANLMWLLGAGASAAAGIPTADSLIWNFKRAIFCAEQRVSIKTCEDLSDTDVQKRLNRYFEEQGGLPSSGSTDEYAAYFEAAYPNASDRRRILEEYIGEARPSYGHLVLATLMKLDKARIIWTPNFDKLIEDSASNVLGSASKFVVATLDNPSIATEAINEGRWPLICKIHGDFQSIRLKNTSEELRTQDAQIRHALVESCRRYGLVVTGYSGRDKSIMEALEQAIDSGRGYPTGIFWFHRPDSPPLATVTALIAKAAEAGIQANLFEVETFDELLGDLIKQFDAIPSELQTRLDRGAHRITDVPIAPLGRGWPVIRLNALPITSWPSISRLVICEIEGTKHVREAILSKNAHALAVRSNAGVLAFGSDEEIRKAFSPFGITSFDCHPIGAHKLHFDSAEMGLLRDAFEMAFGKHGPFSVRRGRSYSVLLVDWQRVSHSDSAALRECVEVLEGVIPHTEISWSEALRIKLDFHLGRLWLLIEPAIYLDQITDKKQRYVAADFVRERLATRYNRQWNFLIEAWITLIFGNSREQKMAAFGIADGVDASFTVGRITGFSRRAMST
jgi:NAD-dependent SIR2 family protein deacetylase